MSRARKDWRKPKRGTGVSKNTGRDPRAPKVGVQIRHEAPIGPAPRQRPVNETDRTTVDAYLARELRETAWRDMVGRTAVTIGGLLVVAIAVAVILMVQEGAAL